MTTAQKITTCLGQLSRVTASHQRRRPKQFTPWRCSRKIVTPRGTFTNAGDAAAAFECTKSAIWHWLSIGRTGFYWGGANAIGGAKRIDEETAEQERIFKETSCVL